MKVLIAHPTGNQNVRAAATGLIEGGIATSFQTTIASFPGDLFNKLSSIPMFSVIRRRGYDSCLRNITETSPWTELGRLISMRVGISSLTRHEHGPFSIDAVYRNLDKHVACSLQRKVDHGLKAVYAYEDGALFSFREAKRLGVKCFYDLPIGYWRAAEKFLAIEKERWPDWASTLTGNYNSLAKLDKKDEELFLADEVFVASRFTADTLSEFKASTPSVKIIQYGFPDVTKRRDYSTHFDRPLKVLFVGGLSQRKGIAYLFEVARALGRHVELTIVGSKTTNACAALDRELSRHRWFPSLPHEQVLEIMRAQDVLVFPSLFEGFGLVITEAMSQGTPVITTERTAGPDLIRNDENGWLAKAGSSEALQATLEKILANRRLVRSVGKEALRTASVRPWSAYGRELAESVKDALKGTEMKNRDLILK